MSENKKKYYKISIDTKNIMDENGNIPEVIKIIAFINFYKEEGSKQPDYILYKDDSKEYNVSKETSEDKFIRESAEAMSDQIPF